MELIKKIKNKENLNGFLKTKKGLSELVYLIFRWDKEKEKQDYLNQVFNLVDSETRGIVRGFEKIKKEIDSENGNLKELKDFLGISFFDIEYKDWERIVYSYLKGKENDGRINFYDASYNWIIAGLIKVKYKILTGELIVKGVGNVVLGFNQFVI